MAVPGEVQDLSAIETQTVLYPDGSGNLVEGYLAEPRHQTNNPAIVVIHEAFGQTEHMRDLCRRFANVGFAALSVNLYARIGSPDPNNMSDVMQKMFGLSDQEAVHHVESAISWLSQNPVNAPKIGVIGFCSGGRHSLLVACQSTVVDAAVDCWGGNITRATPDAITTPERPVPVIDMVADLHCPLFAVFGAEDQNPSPQDAQMLQERLIQHGKPSTVKVFANAGHAFLADYRPSYREGPAFELWPQIVEFFHRHLDA